MIQYAVADSGQTLVFTEPVIAKLVAHQQLSRDSREAGGQLFACIVGTTVQIARATGPRPSDRRARTTFVPDRAAERQEIRRLFKKGLHYVGDWHTHPERHPRPSTTDIASAQDMFRRSHHRLASFVMVIVGAAAFPDGLFVATVTGTKWRQLRASDPTAPSIHC